MKIIKKDYPFTVIIEDKFGKTSGKMYQSICVSHSTVKDKDAQDPKDRYETTYFNFFDERDLLKLSSLAENSYMVLKAEREAEKQGRKEVNTFEYSDNGAPF